MFTSTPQGIHSACGCATKVACGQLTLPPPARQQPGYLGYNMPAPSALSFAIELVDEPGATVKTAALGNGTLEGERWDPDFPVAPAHRLQRGGCRIAEVGDLGFVGGGHDTARPLDLAVTARGGGSDSSGSVGAELLATSRSAGSAALLGRAIERLGEPRLDLHQAGHGHLAPPRFQ
jgi:hypothetical protein